MNIPLLCINLLFDKPHHSTQANKSSSNKVSHPFSGRAYKTECTNRHPHPNVLS